MWTRGAVRSTVTVTAASAKRDSTRPRRRSAGMPTPGGSDPSARATTPPPQVLSRGSGARSRRATSTPARARTSAAVAPAGPAPTTTTSTGVPPATPVVTAVPPPGALQGRRNLTPDHTASARRRRRADPVVQEGLVTRGRWNVLLLALCQAAFISTSALMATIGTLAGYALAVDKALATCPRPRSPWARRS